MKFPYLVGRARAPQPSLGGGVLRPRPIIAVRIFGPASSRLVDGLLDTGSDDTIFPESIATLIGLDLSRGQEQIITLVGRVKPISARFLPADLRVSDGQQTCHWAAIVGFAPIPFRHALLGHAGVLQFFDAEFRGADREVILTPNRSFPGHVI